jgi:glycosyltransferase involved in cell wall biosynthesis
MLRLSIITINYNNAVGLEKTIKSVISQSFKDFEYIIIDGGSTDGSVEVVDQFRNEIDSFVSEKDDGIYHALNKGIAKATCEYLMFLNSGDYLADDTILRELMPLTGKYDIVYGNLLVETASKTWLKKYPDILHFDHFIHDSLPHSGGSFVKKEAFRNGLSRYDENLKIVSDWKWFLNAIFKYNYTYRHIDKTIGVFNFSGISSTNSTAAEEEKALVLQNEFGEIYKEIQGLSAYKIKYETLLSSRYIQLCLKLRKLVFWK